MTLTEEKELVIKKLMGWRLEYCGTSVFIHPCEKYVTIDDWNPQIEWGCWPDIWAKLLEGELIFKYIEEIGKNFEHLSNPNQMYLYYHITSTEDRWKALVRTLEG